MDMSGGGMQGMDHSKMAMPGTGPDPDLPANAAPRTPVPAATDADRAANRRVELMVIKMKPVS
jgi:hypothetical protein